MDATPFVGLLGAVVMWIGLIISLTILRGFIVQGTAWAICEWLILMKDKASQERICRWLGDRDRILEYLEEIKEMRT